LKIDERSRGDDKWLIIQTLSKMGFKIFIPFDKLDEIPAFESITRARRKFQDGGKGKYLPSPKVAEERKVEEKKMRKIEDWFSDG